MPNHVHLIAVPHLLKRRLVRQLEKRIGATTSRINFREGWRGHLWQDVLPLFPWAKPICTQPHALLN
ncbi:MAG: hypothetical protein HUU08_09405 [Candidatus Brocadia sp.]|nr:hypothetical protein [Candidatus Brocadia sp.]